ncbi:HNH endonuclease signature motif containing protein [Geodermatophilus saharensis]|uniref:HNH endonuclease signature motif containing protein n=1 Tax=Geodermatophilus saharensis TaxID=1137994 RepID=UPI003183DFD8
MQEVAEHVSPVERALAGWLLERPVRLARLPVSLLSDEQAAAELQRLQARKAMEAAYEAELVLRLAEARPADDDPPPGTPGARRPGSWAPDTELPGVSEFFTAELALVLNCGRSTASHLATRAGTYRERLPATWAALAAGELDEARAKALADVLQHTTPGIARRIEAAVLPDATALTVGRLEKRAIELLLEADADAVDRRRKTAERRSDVRVYPSPSDGMSTVAADLPTDVAAACHATVDELARMVKADGDPRPIGQLRTVVFADLLQRPWQAGVAVTAHLQIVATLASLAGRSAQAGEVNGLPITAAHLRALLRELDALGVQAPEGGTVTVALTDDDGTLRATATLDRLRRLAARGCREHPDAECGCAVLDRPAGRDGYTPSAAQQAFVRTRDRTCRFPTCGQRVGWADADHVVPHAHGGATDCANLCCLCRSHHRLKTLARGWRFEMSPDGTLIVTTPRAPPAPPGHRACDHHRRRTRNHLERTSRPTRTTTHRPSDVHGQDHPCGLLRSPAGSRPVARRDPPAPGSVRPPSCRPSGSAGERPHGAHRPPHRRAQPLPPGSVPGR